MYSSIGEFLIAETISEDTTSTSGIIISAGKTPRYKVVNPPFEYPDLKDKIVLVAGDDRVLTLPNSQYVSINYKNIIAVEL